MVYLIGDTHGQQSKVLNMLQKMKETDILIILGDFGFIWTKQDTASLDLFDSFNRTILFIDGNHENFNLLDDYDIQEKFNSTVHKVRTNIFHLIRGNVYTIFNKKYFVMGGGTSIDKHHRIQNVTWWSEQVPSSLEMEYGLKNLQYQNNNIDYILSHVAPKQLIPRINKIKPIMLEQKCPVVQYLQVVKENAIFCKWFMGHYHIDHSFDNKYYILYQKPIKINGEIKYA